MPKAVVTITVVITGEQGAAALIGAENVGQRAFRQLSQLPGVVSLGYTVNDYREPGLRSAPQVNPDWNSPVPVRDVTRCGQPDCLFDGSPHDHGVTPE